LRRPVARGVALAIAAGVVATAVWLLAPDPDAPPRAVGTADDTADGTVDGTEGDTADAGLDGATGSTVDGTAGGARDRAVVDRVIDGDTLDVVLGGDTIRVRLLNIDTPETKKRNTPVECLGPEASEYLARLLPAGSAVTLSYDRERTDQYGRTLAAVITSDGENASVELAVRGLGSSVLFEPNDRYHADVVGAEATAARGRVGIFDPAIACNGLR